MPQTPISASAVITSSTPTTLYTVPAGRTAVVKSVLATSLIGNSSLTLNKVSSGTTFPITVQQSVPTVPATGGTPLKSHNLLQDSITLVAGESISASVSNAAQYKFATSYSSSFTINNVYYLNSTWIAIGTNLTNSNGVVLTSSNGTTWTQRTFTFVTNLRDLAFGGGVYVAVGNNAGEVFTSSDLATWSKVTTPNTAALNAIDYNGTNWVAAGNAGAYIYTATPNGTWTSASIPSVTANIVSVAWLSNTWVFGLANAFHVVSTQSNGTSPTSPFSIFAGTGSGFQNVTVSSGGYTTFANGIGVYKSTNNGVTWSLTNSINPSGGNGASVISTTYTGFRQMSGQTYIAVNESTGAHAWTYDSTTWYTGSNVGINSWFAASTAGGTLITINSTRTGGSFVTSYSAGKGYPTFTTSSGEVILTTQFNTRAPTAVFFNRNSTNTILTSGRTGFSTTTYTSNGNSSLTIAAVGTPYISFYNGTNWYAITNARKILVKTSATNATITDTGFITPDVSFIGIDGNSNTYVGVTGTNIYTTVNGGATWSTIPMPGGIRGVVPNTSFTAITYDATTSRFVVTTTTGACMTSTDGLTWNYGLHTLQNAQLVNSQNLYVTPDGLFTSTTPSTSFSLLTSNNLSSGENRHNIVFAGGTYYFVKAGTVTTSTNLSTFTSTSIETTALNNLTYVDTVTCTSDGTNILFSNNQGSLAYVTNPSAALSNAVCNVAAVEVY